MDGSFVEDKVPGDIDVVSFFFRPLAARNHAQLSALMQANRELFFRPLVKAKYKVDLMLVDLNGSPEILVETTRSISVSFLIDVEIMSGRGWYELTLAILQTRRQR